VIAWGEIGLDYHYDHSPRDVQREVFRRQLLIARELQLPVVIHSRDADDDTIEILRGRSTNRNHTGVLHCFGGTLKMAEQAIDLGFYVSFAGNLTFKKADDLRAIAQALPLDRLLIETDCPYLTPVPFRGKRNEPARVVETARLLAELKGLKIADIARITTENFGKLFAI
jgi:TatD DNase family protein